MTGPNQQHPGTLDREPTLQHLELPQHDQQRRKSAKTKEEDISMFVSRGSTNCMKLSTFHPYYCDLQKLTTGGDSTRPQKPRSSVGD